MSFASWLSLHPRFRDLRSAFRRVLIGHMWKKCQLDHRRRWPDDAVSAAKNAKAHHNMR